MFGCHYLTFTAFATVGYCVRRYSSSGWSPRDTQDSGHECTSIRSGDWPAPDVRTASTRSAESLCAYPRSPSRPFRPYEEDYRDASAQAVQQAGFHYCRGGGCISKTGNRGMYTNRECYVWLTGQQGLHFMHDHNVAHRYVEQSDSTYA